MTVPFTGESPHRPQKSSILFKKDDMMEGTGWSRNYDIAPDGRRFLMLKSIRPDFQQINVVENWFEELDRLCPTGSK